MSNNRRKGKAYKPGPVYLNTLAIAMKRIQRLEDVDVSRQRATTMHNLMVLKHADVTVPEDLREAVQHDGKCLDAWRGLADAVNVCEALAEIGIGSGRQAVELIEAANAALAAVHERRQSTGGWSMTPDEVQAIEWLVALHCDTQLSHCSYGEFERAYQRVVRVVRNVMQGNHSPRTKVLSGDIGAIVEGTPA